MLTPALTSPTLATTGPTLSLDAVGQSKLPLNPSGLSTAATIEANLGGTMPPPSNRNLAMAAMNGSEQWAMQVGRLADFLDVNIGGSLNFAHADVRRLAGDLNHNAPDAKVGRDTNALLNDWATKGGQAFQAIRHGLFRNAEQDIGQAANALTRAGVSNPDIQAALSELNSALRLADKFMAHPGGLPGPIGGIGGGQGGPVLDGPMGGGAIGGGAIGGGPIGGGPIGGGPSGGPFEAMIQHAMAKLNQAMGAEAQAHPEHVPALRDASVAVGNAFRTLQQGNTAIYMTQSGIMRDLQQLGWTPGSQPPPRPSPLPLPGPQPTAAGAQAA